MKSLRFTVSQVERIRIDNFLVRYSELPSRNSVQKLISQGLVKINGRVASKSSLVGAEDIVEVIVPDIEPLELTGEKTELKIIFEDDDLMVISKPAGMVVHPAAGHTEGTLVHAVLGHTKDLSGIGGVARPGIIHRLDKDTSGLIIIAKTDTAHLNLSAQIANKHCQRHYTALVKGNIKENSGYVEAPIGRSLSDRKKMAVRADGRPARTDFKVLERFKDYTLLELRLSTGRTHQIRVHMAWIKHPIVGDRQYGDKKGDTQLKLERQFLHASLLMFDHPRSGQPMTFADDLPPDLSEILNRLRQL